MGTALSSLVLFGSGGGGELKRAIRSSNVFDNESSIESPSAKLFQRQFWGLFVSVSCECTLLSSVEARMGIKITFRASFYDGHVSSRDRIFVFSTCPALAGLLF